MKYRRLNQEELESLKTEFIRFLASNTITGDDWMKINTEQPVKAESLIDIFSDIVFEKILEKVDLLERREKSDLKIFKFHKDKITMLGLTIVGNDRLDFNSMDSPQEMMAKIELTGGNLQMYSAEKAYSKARNQEVFDLMEAGALILKDQTLYDTLIELKG